MKKGINVFGLVVSGLFAGWIAFSVDHWLDGFLGLFGTIPGRQDPLGMVQFHLDSVMLAIPFVWPALYRRLPGPGWMKGLSYGCLLHLFVWLFGATAKLGGAVFFTHVAITPTMVASMLSIQLVYGFWLGLLYSPPEDLSIRL